ncbi:MAG: alanyl-tRNA editing protein [Actinobacteria bacterium]|nr:alanyl-tRNA editing protein [Actinomycetota bacterium]
MATEMIFQKDAYVRDFDASVVASEGDGVALDRTAFFPGGGGQPADEGTIMFGDSSRAVLKSRRDGDLIWHELDGPAPEVGAEVEGTLDWDRRHRLMRTHTALHILCGVVWRDYSAKVTGGNMQPLSGRMDFEFENMSGELVGEIEDKINLEVGADRPISVRFLPRDAADRDPDLIRTKINLLPAGITEVRVVDIEGLDLQADGGTHVASTAEVGRINVTGYKSKGKANKRIEIAIA